MGKEVILLIGYGNKVYWAMRFTKEGPKTDLGIDAEILQGFTAAISSFGAEVGATKKICTLSYGSDVVVGVKKGNLVIGLVARDAGKADKVEDVFKDMIETGVIDGIVSAFGIKEDEQFMRNTMTQLTSKFGKKGLV